MPKNIVEDIIVPEKRKSIRDIPIPENRRRAPISNSQNKNIGTDSVLPPTSNPPTSNGGRGNNNFKPSTMKKFSKNTWIGAGIAVLILVFAILSIFGGATLAYTPKSQPIIFDQDVYTANKEGDGVLLYSVVKLSREEGKSVPAGEEQNVERKASGTIVVYNNARTVAQKLVENTRFEAVDGKVYRIQEAISIPGKKTVGGVSQPGTIEVTVYADEAGESYNQGLTDFTVPGLKGTARYETIYARSKTPMSGGFVGMARMVSEENLAKTRMELQGLLETELVAEAQAQTPEDFVLIPSLAVFTYEDLPQTDSDSGTTVNVRGNLNAIMFKKNDLSKHLASKKITLSQDEVVGINALDALSFSFFGTPPSDLLVSSQLSFEVVGETDLVWKTDENALRADLLGKKKDEVQSVLNNYPSILKADATIRPFWKRSFPDNITDITIKLLPIR